MKKLEEMSAFFAARTDIYDEHMLNEVEGCKEGYVKMARLIPEDTVRLLDLGCGTGLELEEIFRLLPDIQVTGIDLCKEMLSKLTEKFPDKNIEIINADYFSVPLGEEKYDCVVSFQTMHHFTKEKKAELYKKIFTCLKKGGKYIECDYMVMTQEEENHWFSENCRLRREDNIPDGVLCHYDTPCTVENQINLLLNSYFSKAEKVFKEENTTMIVAKKGEK